MKQRKKSTFDMDTYDMPKAFKHEDQWFYKDIDKKYLTT